MMPLDERLSDYWHKLQAELFPSLQEQLGPLGERHRQLVTVLEMARPERFLPHVHGRPGRPRADRAALSRAFLAKTIFNIDDTLGLIERLRLDKTLRRLCGWGGAGTVPSEATFSRAFAEFAAARLGPRLLEAVVVAHHGDHLVGHVARDSTAIEARERPARRPRAPAEPKRKRGRPRKGKERKTPPPERRLERQPGQSLAEMTAELPRDCARGVKQNAQGYRIHWTGYKLHIDTADGDIPLSAILTSANTHDSQAAIPLATMTAMRVTSLYDLMDNAYDAAEIKAHSRSLGHVPIIAPHPRGTVRKAEQLAEAKRRRSTGWYPPEDLRYQQRGAAERVNASFKDNFAGRLIRLRGADKIECHCLLALTAIAAIQIVRLLE